MSAGAGLRGPLVLVGCGRMGGAMLRGWLDRGLPRAEALIVEPDPERAAAARELGVEVVAAPDGIAARFAPRVVVVAVKPQAMATVLPAYARFAAPETVFLSIAAGTTIAAFESHLGPAAIVRAMPNTPAAIGRGMLVGCANARVTRAQRGLCEALMAAVGEVAWIEDEDLMDAVTAVSGSGPAYVFLLIECLARAGVAAGLPAALANRLALVTVSGAGELARVSGEPAERLRENVTSPGGTTAAALAVLMADGGLADLMTEAVAAATRRGRELAG